MKLSTPEADFASAIYRIISQGIPYFIQDELCIGSNYSFPYMCNTCNIT